MHRQPGTTLFRPPSRQIHTPMNDNSNAPDIDEAALDKKIWWRIIPFVVLMYFICILDRVNIGYAALTMNPDLGIDPAVFGFISGIFFISYVILEVPSNQLLVRAGPRKWLFRIMVSWGIITILIAFARSPLELGILRFLLGAAEAGFSPGIILYLTFWFRKNRISQALAVFFVAIPLAMVIASPVSTYILSSASWAGLASWRWLFILEGVPAVIVGCLTLACLSDAPRAASWLTPSERDWLSSRLDESRVKSETPRTIPLRQLASTRNLALFCTCGFLVGLFLTSLLFWIPQIVNTSGLSRSITETGLLVMIPYALSAVVMYLWSRHSDRAGERRWHVAVPFFSAAVCLILLFIASVPAVAFVLLTLAIAACYASYAPFFTLTMDVLPPGLRASGVALINAIASAGSFAGPVLLGLVGGTLKSPGVLLLFALLGIALTVCGILLVRSRIPQLTDGN
jgi:MFS transporter, ACS family, tartrate transporter